MNNNYNDLTHHCGELETVADTEEFLLFDLIKSFLNFDKRWEGRQAGQVSRWYLLMLLITTRMKLHKKKHKSDRKWQMGEHW